MTTSTNPPDLTDLNDLPDPTDLSPLFLLRRDIVLLNHGSFGACPRPVFEEYQRWQREFERHPGGYVHRWLENMDAARAALADYLGTAPDQLAFVTNATMGVNVVAHSLRSWLREGDQILTTDHEYGACNNAWAYACSKTGARYIRRHMPLPVSTPEAWVEEFWQGVTPRTRVVYLSHITSPTALTFPVQEICRRAREAGILSVVDGAHVPGQRALDLDAIGADFYTGNCHKWMMGPKGSAFLYARREVQHLIEPLIVGHGWRPDAVSDKPMQDYVEQFGTRDLAAFLAVPAAIDFMRRHDWDAVRMRCHEMVCQTRRRIEAHFDVEPICPESFDWFSQMAAIRLPDRVNLDALRETLHERYRIEMPLIQWHHLKLARLSVQAYTTEDELETLAQALFAHVPECS
ncbi:MAG: aminotransferase class V-fold PLP-dependent enzyme [Anaerolineae bacterium]|nr:aminotransferase class V-fold PLP-dependent enzyme [Candidatus Roseilinea sp.]MDW8450242.1 aminotransferase class V-fold PLP-dependent enzyme [Anaerolineae bacterium]